MEPTLATRCEDRRDVPVLYWRLDTPLLAISSGPLGGGIGQRGWVLNATVPMSYARLDPDAHLAEMARALGLEGSGVGLLTGVDVTEVRRESEAGVITWATVGLGAPTYAAEYDLRAEPAGRVGTINVVAYVPVRLSDAALVNAVATVTEAKTQALRDLAVSGTGTATDAVCVICPASGVAEPFAGPRSRWGARLGRTAHRAIRIGGAAFLDGGLPWSSRVGRADPADPADPGR